ncbi:hypothetical protein MGA3_15336 [Bacillus methanolicus MGA3]|nr:hypothetical protein MGA3_15336 [Bacillus methanolicus MGA3]
MNFEKTKADPMHRSAFFRYNKIKLDLLFVIDRNWINFVLSKMVQ